MTAKKHTLYKIYYGNEVVYLGRTNQRLQARLHGHFFKSPMHRDIDILRVTKIEYTELPTVADMYLYEIYYINKLKPPLNKDDKAGDALTVSLPDVEFKEFQSPLIDKWRIEIAKQDTERNRRQEEQRERAKDFLAERREMRKKLAASELTEQEYEDWLAEQETLLKEELF